MKHINDMIAELVDVANHPVRSVRTAMERTGKKAVGCFPIYTPDELIHAAGAIPVGMWGGPEMGNLSDRYYQTFCCSVVKANTHQALRGDYDFLSAVLVTAYCDTLKCTIENWKVAVPHLNVIPVVYPQNRKLEAGRQFLIEEFQRIRKELEKALETTITDEAIEESFALYEAYRKAMRTFVDVAGRYPGLIDATARHAIIKAAYFMDKEEYIDKINALTEALEAVPAEEHGQKKIILTGLLVEPDEFLDLFGENGLVVVADDLAQESRQFRVEAAAEGDALTRMAGRIADQDGCSFLYDDEKSRGAMLIDLKNKYNADGIVYCQLKFCDPEEFDYPIVKREMEEAGIPLLYIEIEQQMDSVEQLRTRIQTFAEIL